MPELPLNCRLLQVLFLTVCLQPGESVTAVVEQYPDHACASFSPSQLHTVHRQICTMSSPYAVDYEVGKMEKDESIISTYAFGSPVWTIPHHGSPRTGVRNAAVPTRGLLRAQLTKFVSSKA